LNTASVVQSGASVQAREKPRLRLARQAPVFKRPTSPGQRPEKFAGEQQRIVFADDAVRRVRSVNQCTHTPTIGSRIGPSFSIAWCGFDK